MSETRVYLEQGAKRTFASALDWPGWARSGRDEAQALENLAAYADRYERVAKRARLAMPETAFEVVDRVRGSAGTDFGVPSEILELDRTPLSGSELKRLRVLLRAAWAEFDATVHTAPAELRKGPRGGGRDRDAIVDHVVGAEATVYLRKLGARLAQPSRDDSVALEAERMLVLDRLGEPPGDKGWPVRYAVRRIAWHVLDHAWEIEDRGSRGETSG